MLNFTGNQVNFIIRLSSLMLEMLFIGHMAHTSKQDRRAGCKLARFFETGHTAHTSKQGKRKRSRALTSGEQQLQLRKANKLVDALDVIQQDFLKLGIWRNW